MVTADGATITAVTSKTTFKQIQQYFTTDKMDSNYLALSESKFNEKKHCFTVIDQTATTKYTHRWKF